MSSSRAMRWSYSFHAWMTSAGTTAKMTSKNNRPVKPTRRPRGNNGRRTCLTGSLPATQRAVCPITACHPLYAIQKTEHPIPAASRALNLQPSKSIAPLGSPTHLPRSKEPNGRISPSQKGLTVPPLHEMQKPTILVSTNARQNLVQNSSGTGRVQG